MTVAEYIALLQQFPPTMKVVYSSCSEWDDAPPPKQMQLHNKGGFWGRSYGHEDTLHLVDVVAIN